MNSGKLRGDFLRQSIIDWPKANVFFYNCVYLCNRYAEYCSACPARVPR